MTVTESSLRGWKEIAAFLGTSARSAQRWERELGMPVQRLRMTTGSVVSAYPSEIDAWRRRVSADLAKESIQSGGTDDAEAGDSDPGDPADSQGDGPAPHRPVVQGRFTLVSARWALVGLLAFTGVIAATWVYWHRDGRTPEATDAIESVGDVIRVSSGPSTIRLRPGPDGMTTVTLPGVPELRVRTERAGAELAVDVYSATTLPDRPRRLARLRLTPAIPAELAVEGNSPIRFAWEVPRERLR
jgi:hypothetical protein